MKREFNEQQALFVAAPANNLQPQEESAPMEPMFIVTGVGAAPVAKFHARVAQEGQEQKHKGKSYYTGRGRRGHAFHFVNDRTFVFGPVKQ